MPSTIETYSQSTQISIRSKLEVLPVAGDLLVYREHQTTEEEIVGHDGNQILNRSNDNEVEGFITRRELEKKLLNKSHSLAKGVFLVPPGDRGCLPAQWL